MKTALFYLFSLLLLLPILLKAQQPGIEVRGNLIETRLLLNGLDPSKYNTVEGTPYINAEFISSKINDIEETQFVRFNIADNIIEIKTNDEKIAILDMENDCSIQLLDGSGKQYISAFYNNEGIKTKSFFEVVKETEKYTLYKQERKKYKEKQEAEGYKDPVPPKFVDQVPMFFISGLNSDSSDLVRLPKKKKKFVELITSNEKSLDKYIKQEKLNFKKKNDIIKIMDFVSSDNK